MRKGVFAMVRQGVLGKAAPPVSHAVAFAAYAALHTALAKAPWRKATVKATPWGLRVARTTERKTRETAERARLTVADVLAEAVESLGEEVPPPAAADATRMTTSEPDDADR
ncbi:DUF1490 family protein [Mycolicibacter virginiensis]